jgi:hypothetical protein
MAEQHEAWAVAPSALHEYYRIVHFFVWLPTKGRDLAHENLERNFLLEQLSEIE